MKKKIPDQNTDARYTNVILEEMRKQFRVFGEGLTAFREQNLKEHNESNKRLDVLSNNIGDVRVRLSKVEEKIIKVEERIFKLEESNARIEDNIRIIKNNIKSKVDVEEFKLLENRLVILEKRLAALTK